MSSIPITFLRPTLVFSDSEAGSDPEDEVVALEAGHGGGFLHRELPIDGCRIDVRPLGRNELLTTCSCIVEMHDEGLNFDPEDVCCIKGGGQFAERLAKERMAGAGEEDGDDPTAWHARRDPNKNFRYTLYVDFIQSMHL